MSDVSPSLEKPPRERHEAALQIALDALRRIRTADDWLRVAEYANAAINAAHDAIEKIEAIVPELKR